MKATFIEMFLMPGVSLAGQTPCIAFHAPDASVNQGIFAHQKLHNEIPKINVRLHARLNDRPGRSCTKE